MDVVVLAMMGYTHFTLWLKLNHFWRLYKLLIPTDVLFSFICCIKLVPCPFLLQLLGHLSGTWQRYPKRIISPIDDARFGCHLLLDVHNCSFHERLVQAGLDFAY